MNFFPRLRSVAPVAVDAIEFNSPVVQVPFYGDTLEAVRMPNGKVAVHFKRPCENLGVDYSSQLKNMKRIK